MQLLHPQKTLNVNRFRNSTWI